MKMNAKATESLICATIKYTFASSCRPVYISLTFLEPRQHTNSSKLTKLPSAEGHANFTVSAVIPLAHSHCLRHQEMSSFTKKITVWICIRSHCMSKHSRSTPFISLQHESHISLLAARHCKVVAHCAHQGCINFVHTKLRTPTNVLYS